MKKSFIFAVLFLLICLTACNSAAAGEITLIYSENSQFELIDEAGNRVLIDVMNPEVVSAPPTGTDILLTTHQHPDHLNASFISNFPGEQLFAQVGKIEHPGVSIFGIASAHTDAENPPFPEINGTNTIYVIDMEGLRIAHFGDIGQDELTPDQLEALGEVDIALMQFVNSYSQMDTTNQKGFNLMNQVKPKLVIPTHGNGNMAAMGYASEIWPAYANPSNSVIIRGADLSKETKFLIVGAAANSMQALLDLPGWGDK